MLSFIKSWFYTIFTHSRTVSPQMEENNELKKQKIASGKLSEIQCKCNFLYSLKYTQFKSNHMKCNFRPPKGSPLAHWAIFLLYALSRF